MNPQLLQFLMSNPQIIQQLLSGLSLGMGMGTGHPSADQSSIPPPAPPAAEYYGPESGRAQYFANMGLDPNGQPLQPTQPAAAPPPAPPRRPGLGFATPFGQSMMRGGGGFGMGQMFGRRGGQFPGQVPAAPSAGMAGMAGGSNLSTDPASQFSPPPTDMFGAPRRR